MRTLTAAAEARRARADNAPLLLLQIDFTSPSALTLRVSDRPVTAVGQDWLPLVKSWGRMESVLEDVEPGGRPGTFAVDLLNSVPVPVSRTVQKTRLSDLIRTVNNTTNAYEWANATATLYYLVNESLSAGDEVTLGGFRLEDPEEIDEGVVRLRMSTVDLLVDQKMARTTISAADFSLADPDAVGRAVPYVLGAGLKDLPTLAVVAGKVTKLATLLTNPAAGGYMEVTSTSGLSLPLTVQVDAEQIVVSAITAESGSTPGRLTISQRGANGTTALPHSAGASVLEVRSSYVFLAAENVGNFKHSAVSAVKVNDRLLTSDYTVNLDDTTRLAGKSFVSVTLTLLATEVKTAYALAAGNTSFDATNTPAYYALRNTATGTVTLTLGAMTLPALPPTTVVKSVRRTLTMRVTRQDVGGVSNYGIYSIVAGIRTFLGYIPGSPLNTPTTFSYVTKAYGNDTLVIEFTVSSNTNVDVWADKYTASIEIDAGGGGNNSVVDVVVGTVTVNMDGIKDDASGTISGTASLLLENPADQAKFVVSQLYPGLSTADLGTTWAATRSSLATAGYKWAHRLEPPVAFSDLRRAVGLQARSLLYVDSGLVEMRYLADSPAAADTINYLVDAYRERPARVDRTPRTQVWNTLHVYSARDYRKSGSLKDMYTQQTQSQDLTIGGFTDPIHRDVELSYVQDSATASSLGTFWLGRLKRQQFSVSLETWWNAVRLQLGDPFNVSNHPILLAHGDTGLVLRVVGFALTPERRIEIVGVSV